MYMPHAFEERDLRRAHDLIDANAFGMLVVPVEGGSLEIAHLPFLLDRVGKFGVLRADVARANPTARALEAPLPATAIFTGPHAYVTASWYASPRTNVPTWNYAAVHAHGVIERLDGRASHDVVAQLSAKYEKSSVQPWTIDGMDHERKRELLAAIVSFRIEITRIEAKFKLSQNRPHEDRVGIRAGLRARGGSDDLGVCSLMDERDET